MSSFHAVVRRWSAMMVLAAVALSTPSKAEDIEIEQTVERDALSFVDVMPAVEQLTERFGLREASVAQLRGEVGSLTTWIFLDPLHFEVRSPEDLLDLFSTIACLRELHRRDALTDDLRPVEARIAFHLHALGVRSHTDPLFDREVRRWRDRSASAPAGDLLGAAAVSLQAAREIGERWFPEAVVAAQIVAPTDEILMAQIGLWFINAGATRRGLDHLRSLEQYGRDPERLRALYLGLRAASLETEALSLRERLRSKPVVHRRLMDDARRLDDAAAEKRFRTSKRPRDVGAHTERLDRILRRYGPGSPELTEAAELFHQEAPNAPEAYRMLMGLAISVGDVQEAAQVLERAGQAGLSATELAELALAESVLRHLLLGLNDELPDRLDAWAEMHDVSPTDRRAVELLARTRDLVDRPDRRQRARARKDALRMWRRAERGDHLAVRTAWAVLTLDEPVERVVRRIVRSSRRWTDEDQPLAEDALVLALGAYALEHDDSLERSITRLLESSERLGRHPSASEFDRWVLEQIQMVRADPVVPRARLERWNAQLTALAQQLGDPQADRALSVEVARALVGIAILLDRPSGVLEPLRVLRELSYHNVDTRIAQGQARVYRMDAHRGVASLAAAPSMGPEQHVVAAHWRLLGCGIVSNIPCLRQNLRALRHDWPEVQMPERVDQPWAFLVPSKGVSLSLQLGANRPPGVDVSFGGRTILAAMPPRDLALGDEE